MSEIAVPRSLEDIRCLLDILPSPNAEAEQTARDREGQLTKPAGSLGRLEDLAVWLAAWQGGKPPVVQNPQVLVFAGNHGVVEQGVSAFPADVTAQMVVNFAAGGAAINQLCAATGAGLNVRDMALEKPTADFTQDAAMTETECVSAVAAGMAAVPDDADLLGVGEMGIGNTTVAAALSCALFGRTGRDWVGPGTGVDDAGLARKAEAVDAGIQRHKNHLANPFEVLRRLGGREIAAMSGAILAARLKRIPVLLDGYVSCAAAAVLEVAQSGALDHCQAAHRSAEPAHTLLLQKLGKAPLLDLGMRLGEASGAALAIALVKAAAATHGGMATFAEAGVANKDG